IFTPETSPTSKAERLHRDLLKFLGLPALGRSHLLISDHLDSTHKSQMSSPPEEPINSKEGSELVIVPDLKMPEPTQDHYKEKQKTKKRKDTFSDSVNRSDNV
ncbi:hypothetical protein MKW98_012737, partial [Papaver atlanticum]